MKLRKNALLGVFLWLFLFVIPVIGIISLFGKEWGILYGISLFSLELYLTKAENDGKEARNEKGCKALQGRQET